MVPTLLGGGLGSKIKCHTASHLTDHHYLVCKKAPILGGGLPSSCNALALNLTCTQQPFWQSTDEELMGELSTIHRYSSVV